MFEFGVRTSQTSKTAVGLETMVPAHVAKYNICLSQQCIRGKKMFSQDRAYKELYDSDENNSDLHVTLTITINN